MRPTSATSVRFHRHLLRHRWRAALLVLGAGVLSLWSSLASAQVPAGEIRRGAPPVAKATGAGDAQRAVTAPKATIRGPVPDDRHYRAALDGIRRAYRAADGRGFRRAMFLAHALLRITDVDTALRVLRLAAAEATSNGVDGLESVVLQATDAVAQGGTPAQKSSAKSHLLTMRGRVVRRVPPASLPNLKVPLGSARHVVSLDVRGDAVAAIFDVLLARGTVVPLDQLLGLPETAKSLCALPQVRDQNGQLPKEERDRQINCAARGKAGPAGVGPASAALGDLMASACLNIVESDASKIQKRGEAIQACFDAANTTPSRGGIDRVAFGLALLIPWGLAVLENAGAATLAWAASVLASESFATNMVSGLILVAVAQSCQDCSAKEKSANNGLERAAKELVDAAAALATAEDELAKADEEVKQKQAALDMAKSSGDQKQIDQAQGELTTAQGKKEDADKAKKTAEERKKKADEGVSAAVKSKQEGAKKASDAPLSPRDPFASPECRDVLGDPQGRVARERVGADYKEWWRRKLGRVSNPNPTADTPFDVLTMPLCGVDSWTLHPQASRCQSLVLCANGLPDESCRCRGSVTDEARLSVRSAVAACAATRCPNGPAIARGLMCLCGEDTVPEVATRAPKPKAIAIDSIWSEQPQGAVSSGRVTRELLAK